MHSLFDGMEGFVEDKSGPISSHAVAAVRPHWFTRLQESFHYQLFQGPESTNFARVIWKSGL
jgi:hypothetical protein